jgi:hypothetical protein
MGEVDGTGVLRYAQDDSKNAEQQKHATAKTNNSKDKQRQEREADPLRG